MATVKTGRWKENAYVVQHVPSGEAVLVDPGDDAERIMGVITAFDASPRVILLTHAHFDHIGALDVLCREYGLPFHMHSRDQPLLRRASLYAMSFERRIITVPDAHVPLEGAELDWEGAPIDYVHTPGHTDGGVCYHWDGLCFTGDTLMKRLIGRTDLPGSSGVGLSESISQLLETLA
ncbi:MAG: MBL fold metallo-hydrolase, partial [Rhodospirillales bacterium]